MKARDSKDSFDLSDGNMTTPATDRPTATGGLPQWRDIYEGSIDTEVAEIEKSIVRSGEGRSLA